MRLPLLLIGKSTGKALKRVMPAMAQPELVTVFDVIAHHFFMIADERVNLAGMPVREFFNIFYYTC